MSSRQAGAKMGRDLLLLVLTLIVTGKPFDEAPRGTIRYLLRYGYLSGTLQKPRLTLKGRATLSEAKIWELTIPAPRRWDGKWHFVLFDIPADRRKRRDIFRARLKELGLVLYQNSVWIYPYPLEEVVRQVAAFYHLSPCISFIVAEHITGQEKLKARFGLK